MRVQHKLIILGFTFILIIDILILALTLLGPYLHNIFRFLGGSGSIGGGSPISMVGSDCLVDLRLFGRFS